LHESKAHLQQKKAKINLPDHAVDDEFEIIMFVRKEI
jgi:hypothetical protein